MSCASEPTGRGPRAVSYTHLDVYKRQERYSFFNRQTFLDNLFSDPLNAHVATFQEYPGKKAVIKENIQDFLLNK